ncbi:hypothetical protein GCM10017687_31160 [Streptomyces echinatus]
MAPLARDLTAAYEARRDGRAPDWPALPIQYADYTLWQQELLGGEDDPESLISEQVEYWRKALAGLPEELRLPVDRQRPATPGNQGGNVPFRVSAELHRKLSELAARSDASLYMVVQAGLAALLSRLGAGTDIPLGSPIAGRTEEGLDELVGFFVNTLVMRLDTAGDPSFRELIARSRQTALGAYANQELPFERLVDILRPDRTLGRHPLFQVMLAFQNNTLPQLRLPGLVVEGEQLYTETSKFDLAFSMGEQFDGEGRPLGLGGTIEYATDLFDRESVERLGARLIHVFEAMTADPGGRVGAVDVLLPGERQQVLETWNRTEREVPAAGFAELFRARAAAAPDATALVSEAATLTYGELDAAANRLARLLAGRGAGPGHLVALALPRSVELVTAMLAVAKAGAAYLPVDTGYPRRAHRVHARGLPPGADGDDRGADRTAAGRRRGPRAGRRAHRHRAAPVRHGRPAVEPDARQPAVRDLHLGIHREAEGRGGDGRRRGQHGPQPARAPGRGAGQPGAAVLLAELRRRLLGLLHGRC